MSRGLQERFRGRSLLLQSTSPWGRHNFFNFQMFRQGNTDVKGWWKYRLSASQNVDSGRKPAGIQRGSSKQVLNKYMFYKDIMARPGRFELPTSWSVVSRSIQLSYGRTKEPDTTQRCKNWQAEWRHCAGLLEHMPVTCRSQFQILLCILELRRSY